MESLVLPEFGYLVADVSLSNKVTPSVLVCGFLSDHIVIVLLLPPYTKKVYNSEAFFPVLDNKCYRKD